MEVALVRGISPSGDGAQRLRPLVLPLLEEVLPIPRQRFRRHQNQPNSMGSHRKTNGKPYSPHNAAPHTKPNQQIHSTATNLGFTEPHRAKTTPTRKVPRPQIGQETTRGNEIAAPQTNLGLPPGNKMKPQEQKPKLTQQSRRSLRISQGESGEKQPGKK